MRRPATPGSKRICGCYRPWRRSSPDFDRINRPPGTTIQVGMQPNRASALLDFFRRSLPGFAGATPDGELLARFVATRDEAAFELLVRRHGPMVYGVARRVLRDGHAAEDVLQATFLALARRASSLRRHTAVPAWLYRVAVRAASRVRTPATVNVSPSHATTVMDDALERAELRAALDDAIDRLPEKLRRAVVLCYVAGNTT